MHIPVAVKFLSEDNYQAQAPSPFDLAAVGTSPQEAVDKLRLQIEQELSKGERVVMLNVAVPDENPWVRFAGHLKDDTFFSDWQAGLEEYRRQRDPDDE